VVSGERRLWVMMRPDTVYLCEYGCVSPVLLASSSIGKVGDLGLTFVSTFELKVSDEVPNNDGKKIQKTRNRVTLESKLSQKSTKIRHCTAADTENPLQFHSCKLCNEKDIKCQNHVEIEII
jgi:hypothetical protein